MESGQEAFTPPLTAKNFRCVRSSTTKADRTYYREDGRMELEELSKESHVLSKESHVFSCSFNVELPAFNMSEQPFYAGDCLMVSRTFSFARHEFRLNFGTYRIPSGANRSLCCVGVSVGLTQLTPCEERHAPLIHATAQLRPASPSDLLPNAEMILSSQMMSSACVKICNHSTSRSVLLINMRLIGHGLQYS